METHKNDNPHSGASTAEATEPGGGSGSASGLPAVPSVTAPKEPREPRDQKTDKYKAGAAREAKAPTGAKNPRNNVRKLRMERMMSRAELARRAGVSTLTIDRVERGLACRMDTKRKILEALELKPSDRVLVFGEDD